jgi:UDPglucose 6-dehydrogenase
MKSSIAIIGCGFVGGSLASVFAERDATVFTYDKIGRLPIGSYRGSIWPGPRAPKSITELIIACENVEFNGMTGGAPDTKHFSGVYFVCVPTPMYEDGSADISIVDSVLTEMASVPGDRIAVIKSTVPPGSTDAWNKKFEGTGLRVVFSPEFLTEANALDDMRNQNRIILGGPRPWINKVKQIFQSTFPNVPIIKTSSTNAECIKYFTNIQLAARVVLSCEFKQVCDALDSKGLDVDYDKVLEYAKYDQRLGNTHMNVPGNDGISGARGHCFPKDLNAFIDIASKNNVNPAVMKAIWQKNLELIPSEYRDWEKMTGRAVSKKTSK